jgi:hypothetical protein
MAPAAGLEPATSRLTTGRYCHLSYAGMIFMHTVVCKAAPLKLELLIAACCGRDSNPTLYVRSVAQHSVVPPEPGTRSWDGGRALHGVVGALPTELYGHGRARRPPRSGDGIRTRASPGYEPDALPDLATPQQRRRGSNPQVARLERPPTLPIRPLRLDAAATRTGEQCASDGSLHIEYRTWQLPPQAHRC